MTTTAPPTAADRDPVVLVVDDTECVREVLQAGLRPRGFDVHVARDGREAIELYHALAQEGRSATVVLDVQMPGLDGPLVLSALRAMDPRVRAYFMTGDPGGYGVDELLSAGARRVFAKPIDIAEVAGELRRVEPDAEREVTRADPARPIPGGLATTDEARALPAAWLSAVGGLAARMARDLTDALKSVNRRLEVLLAATPAEDSRRNDLEAIDREVLWIANRVIDLHEFACVGRGRVPTASGCGAVPPEAKSGNRQPAGAGAVADPERTARFGFAALDRRGLRQAILNLLADEVSKPGDDPLAHEITDIVPGIPPQVLPRDTDPYHTGGEESKGKALGLSSCKRIAEQSGDEPGATKRE
jgi:CheY-like chemotaxis protein